MKRKPTKTPKVSKKAVEAAAARAEARSKGEEIEDVKIPIDPTIIRSGSSSEADAGEGTDRTSPKRERGRPTLYKPEYAVRAAELCDGGATDQDLAHEFDVSLKSINRWKAAHNEFRLALKDNKPIADDRVQRSLYHKAVGAEYEETQAIKLKRTIYEDGKRVREEEYVELVPVRKAIPADTTAAIFWLKNRRSQEWREVSKVEHGQPGDFDTMSDEDLKNYILSEQEMLQESKRVSRGKPSTKH